MKKSVLLLLVIFFFSCKQHLDTKLPRLLGKYTVVGFKVKTDMDKDGGRLIAVTDGQSYAFNFINDNALRLNPKLGMEYFSDSVFKYKRTDTTLLLSGKNGDFVIPYRRDGDVLNLFINTNGIDTLQIIPVKKAGLN